MREASESEMATDTDSYAFSHINQSYANERKTAAIICYFNMMEREKFSVFVFVLLTLLSLIMPACSSQDDVKGMEKIEAPSDATGEFKFYKGDNLKWSFKVLPASDPTSSIVLINSTTAQVNGTGTFYYHRINETSASVSCYFVTRIAVGGNLVGQWNQYEITLTFLSAHHGYFTGVEKKNPEDAGSEIRGRFVYDSKMELEEILEKYGDDDNDDPDVNWSCLTKYDWLNRISDYSWTKYSFGDDGKVVFEAKQGELTRLSGTYIVDKKESTLRVTFGDITEFEVLSLDDNSLKICNAELGVNFATVYEAIPKQEISEGNVNISAPEFNVAGSTLQVKGTILSSMELDSKGVILSLEPNGNVEKCEERLASLSNIVDLKFSIAAGYKYYVRLFAKIKGGDYVYGEEKVFTAPGKKVTQVEGEQVYWNPCKVKVRLKLPPYLIKDYGICWSEKPLPTITDNYLPEKKYDSKQLNRVEDWELKDLKRETKYYIRTYHIEGAEIIYYPGVAEVQTLGLDKKFDLDLQFNPANFKTGEKGWWFGELSNVNFHVSWKGLPKDSYKAEVYFYSLNDYGSFRSSFYIDGEEGEKDLFANKLVFYYLVTGSEPSCGSYVTISLSKLDNTSVATAYYRCAWNYQKFVFNPVQQGDRWVFSGADSEAALIRCMLNE